MHDLEHALRKTGLAHQLGQADRDGRVFLRRLQDHGIAGGQRHAHEPHRDHGREVERRNARDHAQRLAHGIDINARAGALGVFALHQVRHTAGEFDHFQTADQIALGVGDDLAMLGGEEMGKLVHLGLDEVLVGHQDPGPALRVHRSPFGLGRLGRLDGTRHLIIGRELDAGLHLTRIRVEDVAKTAGRARLGLAVDEMMDVTRHVLSLPVEILERSCAECLAADLVCARRRVEARRPARADSVKIPAGNSRSGDDVPGKIRAARRPASGRRPGPRPLRPYRPVPGADGSSLPGGSGPDGECPRHSANRA